MDNTIEGLADPFIGPFAGRVFCPPYKQWPALEAFWDVFWDPMVCEYDTVFVVSANVNSAQ
jgi:hypothetical protein